MTLFTKSIASLLVIATFAVPVAAEAPVAKEPTSASIDSERMALARQFLSATYSEQTFFDLVKGSSRSAAEAFAGSVTDDEAGKINARLDRYLKAAEPIIRKHASLILEVHAAAIARAYTTAELRELVAFASSPIGKKYLTTSDGTDADPAVMAAYMDMHEEMQPLMLDIQKAECAAAAQQRLALGDKSARCPLADDSAEASGRD